MKPDRLAGLAVDIESNAGSETGFLKPKSSPPIPENRLMALKGARVVAERLRAANLALSPADRMLAAGGVEFTNAAAVSQL
jgi:hypothetical protein